MIHQMMLTMTTAMAAADDGDDNTFEDNNDYDVAKIKQTIVDTTNDKTTTFCSQNGIEYSDLYLQSIHAEQSLVSG